MNKVNKLQWLTEEQVRLLAKEYDTPVFVYELDGIAKSVRQLASLTDKIAVKPIIRYSIKANPIMAILSTLDKAGCFFDASSTWEARRAILAGIDPKKILITAQELSNGWDDLVEQGVEIDAGSLQQLRQYGARFPGTAISVRLNPGFGSGLVQRLTSGGSLSSFGIWHELLDEVLCICNKFDLRVIRIHTHIGSGHNSQIWIKAQKYLCSLLDFFPEVRVINMGGVSRKGV